MPLFARKDFFFRSFPHRRESRAFAGQPRYSADGIIVVDEIYSAFADHLPAIIRNLGNKSNKVYLFGHNPEITLVVNLLGKLNIDNMPTCGIVALKIDIESWQKISVGNGLPFFSDCPGKDERQ